MKFIRTSIAVLISVQLIFIGLIDYASAGFTDDNSYCRSVFKDISQDTMMCKWGNYLYYNKIINGYSDATYREGNYVTRQEFSKYMVNTFGIDLSIVPEENIDPMFVFPDVPKDNVFFKEIHALRFHGIVTGFRDGTYHPEANVTRAEAHKFIINAAKSKNPNLFVLEQELPFNDISHDNLFYSYISKSYAATKDVGIYDQMVSVPENRMFRPDDSLKRGELAKIISNAAAHGGFRNDLSSNGAISSSYKVLDSGHKLYQYDQYGMTLLMTKQNFKYHYIPNNTPSVQQFSNNVNYSYVINGGFFGGDHLSADHAGFLNYYGLHLTPLKGPNESMQLTHVVRYNNTDSSLAILDRNGFQGTVGSTEIVEFQSGPLVLFKNEIMQAHIEGSNNGTTKHTRTLMGSFADDPTEKFFIIVRTDINLNELARILLNLDAFNGRPIHVINLDGGSSVTFFSRNYPQLNYRTEQRMPILVGMR